MREELAEQKLSIGNYKERLQKMVCPLKDLINKSTYNFHEKILANDKMIKNKKLSFMNDPTKTEQSQHQEDDSSHQYQQGYENQSLTIIKDEKPVEKCNQLREWKINKEKKKQNNNSFQDLTTLYQSIFEKKIWKREGKCNPSSYDFKDDEKSMLMKIFQSIKSEESYASFSQISTFFESCSLFYLYYNINPNNLINILKESARSKSNKLTRKQFLGIFYNDRPNIIHLEATQLEQVNRRCILDEESWKELKSIFDTLDTFGNETIHVRPFYHKIKNNYSNRQLINAHCIEFPEINRIYPLSKIIFDLENKYSFPIKVQWKHIQDAITNFNHQEHPTLDQLYQLTLEKAEIHRNFNYFSIHDQAIQQIKIVFQRSPKYCEFFVKTKLVASEMLESLAIRPFFNTTVRKNQCGKHESITTFEDQIRMLASSSLNYVDLDQLLEYFSIKGLTTVEEQDYSRADLSSDESLVQENRKINKNKSLENIKSHRTPKHKIKKNKTYVTIFEEFSLSKKERLTIAETKTNDFFKQKELEDQKELLNKFKSQPIPGELNAEHYKKHLKKMQKKKREMHLQLNKKRQDDKEKLQFLKSKTKIFETVKPIQTNNLKMQVKFVAKSIPWFVSSPNLLSKINDEKLIRRANLKNKNKVQIMREWKKLPQSISPKIELNEENQDSMLDELEGLSNEHKIKVKEVPNFEELHKRFQEELAAKRQEFEPTIPKQFKFSTSKHKEHLKESKCLNRIKTEVRLATDSKHRASRNTVKTPQPEIPTTKKYQSMVIKAQEKLRQLVEMQEAEKDKNQQRRLEQQDFAKFMKQKLKRSLHKSASLHHQESKNKIKNHHKNMLLLKKQSQKELGQIYSRVLERPFLFQLNSTYIPSNHQVVQHKLKKVSKKIKITPAKQPDPKYSNNYQMPENSDEERNKQRDIQKMLNQSF